jgi:toxin ParE1/3/4
LTATFSRVASADVQKAYDWYEAQRQGLGSEFLGRVEQAVARIERNPLAYGKVVLDARRVNLQQFPYTLFYKIRESGKS